jgi:hypothetical protein
MAITLELSPETEILLTAQANAQGVSVQQLIQNAVELLLATSNSANSNTPSQLDPNSTEEWIQAFLNWSNSHSLDTPLLSNEAVSRESIYRDREDAQR